MIFATPIAAFGLTTAVALAAIYCFRRRSPERQVGSLMLWPRPKTVSTQSRRRDRIELPPLFWIELLALLALVAAALTPLAWRRSAGTLHVVLDDSPSMHADGGEAARLANEAKEKFDELAIKSSGKKTTWNRFDLKEFKFEAIQPKDSDYGYVRVVIFDLELAPKKDEDDEDD